MYTERSKKVILWSVLALLLMYPSVKVFWVEFWTPSVTPLMVQVPSSLTRDRELNSKLQVSSPESLYTNLCKPDSSLSTHSYLFFINNMLGAHWKRLERADHWWQTDWQDCNCYRHNHQPESRLQRSYSRRNQETLLHLRRYWPKEIHCGKHCEGS